jgi:hypothetical protein
VVDHGVDVDLDAGLAALADHRLELVFIAHPARQVVSDWLINLPPRMQDRVAPIAELGALERILRRRHLDAGIAVLREYRALPPDGLPVPFPEIGCDAGLID